MLHTPCTCQFCCIWIYTNPAAHSLHIRCAILLHMSAQSFAERHCMHPKYIWVHVHVVCGANPHCAFGAFIGEWCRRPNLRALGLLSILELNKLVARIPVWFELSKLHVLIPAGVRTSSLAVFIPVRKKDPLGTLGAHVSMRSRLQSRRWARNTHEIIGVSNLITLIPARRTYSHGVFGPFIGENQSHYIVSYILHAGPFFSLFIQRRYSAGF